MHSKSFELQNVIKTNGRIPEYIKEKDRQKNANEKLKVKDFIKTIGQM